MNSTIYKIISITGFTMSGIMLVVTAILFVRLNILKIIGELTGRTARKEIQEISRQTMAYKTTGGLKRRRNGASAYLARGILQGGIVSEKTDLKVTDLQGDEGTTPLIPHPNNPGDTQPLDHIDKLKETQILVTTDKLEEWMAVPIKDADATFEIIKDEILVHSEDTTETELLSDKN